MITEFGLLHYEGGRGAVGVLDGDCPCGDVRLLQVVGSGDEVAAVETLLDLGHEIGIANEFPARDFSDDLAGEVVLGGTDAARGDDGVGALHGAAKDFAHAAGVVADDGLVEEVDAEGGQLLGHPSRVGINDLAEKDFGAYGDDFCVQDCPRFRVLACAGEGDWHVPEWLVLLTGRPFSDIVPNESNLSGTPFKPPNFLAESPS